MHRKDSHPAATAAPAQALSRALLIPREVRERLRVCDTTLRRLDHEGLLVPLRVGGKARRYRPEDVDQYLNRIAADARA